jgi:hypothetical protein
MSTPEEAQVMPATGGTNTVRPAVGEEAGWGSLRPAKETLKYSAGNSPTRTEFVAGLRSLADRLAGNPEIPIPRNSIKMLVFASGTDEEKYAQVDYASKILTAPVTDETAKEGHYLVTRDFGPVRYEFIAIPSAHRKRARTIDNCVESIVRAISGTEGDNTPPRLAASDVPRAKHSGVPSGNQDSLAQVKRASRQQTDTSRSRQAK